METFTIEDIRSWNPCYDPARHLPETWSGTFVKILKHKAIPAQDKLWVVCREELISAKTLRFFAVWCARQVEHLLQDERSISAIKVAERFANGDATNKELLTAYVDARNAVKNIAEVAEAAVETAARDSYVAAAAYTAAYAAYATASNDTKDAARHAACTAADAAANDATYTSAYTWYVIKNTARENQVKKLIEMVEAD